jgi:hypothetical protein
MKAVKASLPADQVPAFEARAQAFAKKVVANFKDFEFVSVCLPSVPSVSVTSSPRSILASQ